MSLKCFVRDFTRKELAQYIILCVEPIFDVVNQIAAEERCSREKKIEVKRNLRRILSWVTVVVMLFSSAQVSVFAEEAILIYGKTEHILSLLLLILQKEKQV